MRFLRTLLLLSRVASSRPNAIICKFVRRLARDEVMAARREVSNLNAEDLGFSGEVEVSHINLYDHLTPRLQELLFESKKGCEWLQILLGEEWIRLLAEDGYLSRCKIE